MASLRPGRGAQSLIQKVGLSSWTGGDHTWLDTGDGGGGGAQGMGAKAGDVIDDAGRLGMGFDDLVDAVGIDRFFEIG